MKDFERWSLTFSGVNYHIVNTGRAAYNGDNLEHALLIIGLRPINAPVLHFWVHQSDKPNHVCVGVPGSWKQHPVAVGPWAEMFSLFCSYARML